MKKVLLVNTNTERSPYPIPPLGLALVARDIEKDFEVRIFDGMFDGPGELESFVREFCPDYIGVGIRNVDDVVMDSGVFYLDVIKEKFIKPIRAASSAPLILGGGAFSIFPKEMLEFFGADFGVVGEGEGSFASLLRTLAGGGETGKLVESSSHPEIFHSDLDTRLNFVPYNARSSYPLQTKRGCNLKCIYCSYPTIEGSSFRLREPRDIVNEIEAVLERLGNVNIEFVDSTFNAPAGHAESICREIIARGFKVRLRTMGVNPGGITNELLSLMKQAGFVQIDCTPDSGSAQMLKSLGKSFGRDKLERAASIIRDHQMPTMWFFMFGGPGETLQTIDETFDFIDRFVDDLDMVHMTCGIRVFPNTKLAEVAVAEGVIKSSDKLLHPTFYVSKELTKEQLSSILNVKAQTRLNCINALESSPDKSMIGAAMELRVKEGLDEPMFRSLLRIRRMNMGNK